MRGEYRGKSIRMRERDFYSVNRGHCVLAPEESFVRARSFLPNLLLPPLCGRYFCLRFCDLNGCDDPHFIIAFPYLPSVAVYTCDASYIYILSFSKNDR